MLAPVDPQIIQQILSRLGTPCKPYLEPYLEAMGRLALSFLIPSVPNQYFRPTLVTLSTPSRGATPGEVLAPALISFAGGVVR